MKNYFKLLLIALSLMVCTTLVTECPYCEHVCDKDCTYNEESICQHECEYSIDPLAKWEPWG